MAKPSYNLGTAVKITVTLSVSNAEYAKITIKDPSDIAKVTDGVMIADTDTVWHYIYQSATTDNDGEYEITIKAKYGNYIALSKAYFYLIED